MADERIFSIAGNHPPKEGLTISTSSGIDSKNSITYFSLGAGTDISPETYARPVLYVGAGGEGVFLIGEAHEQRTVGPGELLMIEPGTLSGTKTKDGFVYTEIMPGKEITMNSLVKSGEVFNIADLVPYEKGSIVNLDIASNDTMKYVVMAFDEGTGLSPHRAPGDALVFALEGKAVIGYEGEDFTIEAGQTFRFDKNGLHSVTADGKFKMALLLVLK